MRGHGLGIAVSATVLLLGTLLVGWRVVVLQQTAQEARDHLSSARAALSETVAPPSTDVGSGRPDSTTSPIGRSQLISACAEAAAASTALADVNGQLQTVMPLVSALESVPVLGKQARSKTATLEAGTRLAAAGTSLCDGLGPLAALVTGGGSAQGTGSAGDLLKILAGNRPKLLDAAQRLEQLQVALDQIQEQDLEPDNRTAVVALRQRLPQAITSLRDTTMLLDLLGARGTRRYLLVSQNPDELRATGGFIGSAGIIEAEAGGIRLVEYGSSRRYDTPQDMRVVPPAEFQNYLGSFWNLNAANWWVSFPEVAHQLTYFFSLSHPAQPLDGVVALDQFGLQRLLDVLGPVEVPEYGELVGAAHVQPKLDHYVHAGDAYDESGRKQFTAALSAAVLQSILNAPRSASPALVQALRSTLGEQHLLIWVSDPDAATLVASRRWDGGVIPTSGDSLLLVDTELVSSKQSQAVSRDAAYSVSLAEPTGPIASLKITYANTARPERRPDVQFVSEYRTFLRVFAPSEAMLVSSSGFVSPAISAEECGRRVFAGEVAIAEGSTTHVTLDYRLPPSVVTGGYDLLVQQQPGVPPGLLSVAVTTGDGSVARTSVSNGPGQHARLRLSGTDLPALESAQLPLATLGGCHQPLVQAHRIAPPESIRAPSARISAQIVELGVDDKGEMEAPPTPDIVGWYRMSSRPGQPGNEVLSGHVDWSRNTAVFWGLRQLRPGDPIEVRDTDGVVHTYAVEWNEVFTTQTAPVQRIVGPSKDSVLTLITCAGVYDTRKHEYSERRVVRARLVN